MTECGGKIYLSGPRTSHAYPGTNRGSYVEINRACYNPGRSGDIQQARLNTGVWENSSVVTGDHQQDFRLAPEALFRKTGQWASQEIHERAVVTQAINQRTGMDFGRSLAIVACMASEQEGFTSNADECRSSIV